MNDRIFVVAGTRAEYNEFTRKKCDELLKEGNTSISLSNFIYVDSEDKLRGFSNPHGYFIGSWRTRSDIERILVQIESASTYLNSALDKIFFEYNKWKRENS